MQLHDLAKTSHLGYFLARVHYYSLHINHPLPAPFSTSSDIFFGVLVDWGKATQKASGSCGSHSGSEEQLKD